jgi:hypothetical protein
LLAVLKKENEIKFLLYVKIDAGKFLRFDYCFNLNIASLKREAFEKLNIFFFLKYITVNNDPSK